eukprot:CAMPEP_0181223768 /NCGR_PEP_ID=MMETSP1096-20121128/30734_1 /TAXON_ID=156174 ORGANISM="Chrysochromulina ericina, Strain CCMP281" /NCGR_SAMPLE_ID=MMETSP1096 /ASSEMBLY_ACC=CAM_ASM_000453 /LENGTH=43 /DNA_ID= /DNA_START= /DNA_END= /DNA_ORIENTATION=
MFDHVHGREQRSSDEGLRRRNAALLPNDGCTRRHWARCDDKRG